MTLAEVNYYITIKVKTTHNYYIIKVSDTGCRQLSAVGNIEIDLEEDDPCSRLTYKLVFVAGVRAGHVLLEAAGGARPGRADA